ncbi:MAG: ABC transporter permease [Synergistaceae bacterium]|nr:ABC transporter permease [Synergistaceae bacterium]
MAEKKNNDRHTGMIADTWKRLKKDKMAVASLVILTGIVLMAIFAPFLTKYSYSKQDLGAMLQPPSANHFLGTDNFGRDIYTRILYGARISLLIAVVVVVISSGAGYVIGALAGYFKTLDMIVMRVVDVLAGIPSILLAISLAASFGAGMRNLILALGISYMPTCIRIVRSSVLSLREQEFIEAAISIGAGNSRIIFLHIMPNALSPIIVQSTLNIARTLISSATLSFLGLGVQPPSPEWGSMLSAGRAYIQNNPHMVIVPGLAIIVTTYTLNLLGDGLRDALDPHLKD